MTRTEPGAGRTAARLRDLGYRPLVAPLLRVERTGVELCLEGVAALAFTSANGVEAYAAAHDERDLQVFAVGQATAQAAMAAGFGRVRSADGDVVALVRLIVAHRDSLAGVVLHAGAEEPAGDLVGALRGHGIRARSAACYRTVSSRQLDVLPAGYDGGWRAALVHSPKAAHALVALLPGLPQARLWVCISPAAAAPLLAAGLHDVRAATHPDEPAMLAILRAAVPVESAAACRG